MPCATGALRNAASEEDARGTAVFARANTGMTSSDVQGVSEWCMRSRIVSLSAEPAVMGGAGSAMAVNTPAMSALIPPRRRQYQSATPAITYSGRSASRARRESANSPAHTARAAVRYGKAREPAKLRVGGAHQSRLQHAARRGYLQHSDDRNGTQVINGGQREQERLRSGGHA